MFLFTRIWNSIFSRKLNNEIQQELETHLALLEEEALGQGLSSRDAATEARRRFGSAAKHFENARDADLSVLVSELGQDTRFAFRQMRKNAGFSIVAAAVIGLGIGSVTTVFSLVNAVLIHSFPYGHPERLVYLWTPNPHFGANVPAELAPSYPDFYDWQRTSRSFLSLAMVNEKMINVMDTGGSVTRMGGAFATGGFFETLQVKPQLGRGIDQTDDATGHGKVVVISDALWHEKFGAKSDALGKTLTLNREKYMVTGVMPADFGYPFEGDVPYSMHGFRRTDLWMPLAVAASKKLDRQNFESADAVIGRLRPGVTAAQAQGELAAIENRLNALYSNEFKGWTALAVPLVETITGPVAKMLWLLLCAVGLVLLIACGNVANLLLARVTGRLGEMAVRVGLGAGRARLVRQMLTESMVLALLGGTAGVLLSLGAIRVLAQLNPGNIPRFDQASVSLPVLGVALAVSLFSGGLFSLAPIQAVFRPNLSELLKSGNKGTGGSSNRLRHALVVSEVALSFVLLTGAVLLIRSYLKLQAQNPGFSSSTLTMNLPLDDRYGKPEQRTAIFMRFLTTLRRLPGTIQAGAGSDLPLDNLESVSPIEIKGFGQPKDMVDARSVTPGYFDALGMQLMVGRFFDEHDRKNITDAVIVNQAFVKAYLHGTDPLKGQVRSWSTTASPPWRSVVGVVGDRRHSTLEETPRPEYFEPYTLTLNASNMHFALRSKLPTQVVVPSVRKALRDLDPALALDDVHTMEERMVEASARRRFQMVLLTAFGGVAIFLAMIGIYGVMAYSVRQRTAEIGLRMALGASSQQVLLMIARQGLLLVAIGLAIGIAAALVVTRALGAWLYRVGANDPPTFILLPLMILAVAGCACLVPACKASRVDPALAMRND